VFHDSPPAAGWLKISYSAMPPEKHTGSSACTASHEGLSSVLTVM
jgi:hypothetical protein